MKKWCALLLTILMLTGSVLSTAVADEEYLTFPSLLTSVFEKSASEWYSSSYDRALFTLLLSGDFMVSTDIAPDLLAPSYVALCGTGLLVCFSIGGDSYIVAAFEPSSGNSDISYERYDSAPSTLIESALSKMGYPYIQNTSADIAEAASFLADFLSD